MVHSGGFYEVVKRRSLAPPELPARLHWFKWQAYTTWISGFALLAIVYWLGGRAMLVDPRSTWTAGQAIALSAGLLVAGWLVYDGVWTSPLGRRPALASGVLLTVLAFTAFGLTHAYGGRAAFMQLGAMLGTIMAANVWRRIIPAQTQMLAATRAATPVDTSLGLRAKTRSIHNHYLTLPVLFTMLSSHFPSTYGHPQAWLVLLLVMAFGAALKHVMNVGLGRDRWVALAGAFALLSALALTFRPTRVGSAVTPVAGVVSDAQAAAIVQRRCTNCHALHPSNPSFPSAPNGVTLESVDAMRAFAPRILVRAVQTRTMPLGNLTGMTDAERDSLAAWLTRDLAGH